jgi:flagellar motor protein MotB
MKQIPFLITLFMLFFTACITPKTPPPQVIKKAPVCLVSGTEAPLWSCEKIDKSFFKPVIGMGDSLDEKAMEKRFEKLYEAHVKSELDEKKLSKQDKQEILDDSKHHLEKYYSSWLDTNNIKHGIYSISKEDFDQRVAKSIEKHKYTRVYQNCFKTGRTRVEKSCTRKIKAFLKETPLSHKRNIIIAVYTDKVGSAKKNLAISKKRAKNTVASLYYKEYLNSHVYYAGFGESEPLYDSETKEANYINRRLVITLKDKHAKIDTKKYIRYKKAARVSALAQRQKNAFRHMKPKAKVKHTKVKVPVVNRKKMRVKFHNFTGDADIGWVYFGKPSLQEKFEITCVDDKPRKVKRKAISKSKTSEFMEDLNSKRISGDLGQKFVDIYPVYLYENGYLPKSNPIVTVYDESSTTKRYQTTVNTYRGKKGILYRIFINGDKKMNCMDLVISYKTKEVSFGRAYINEGNKTKEIAFILE